VAYNEALAHRVREALAGRNGVTEKRMFGGLTFMLADKMCCGVVKDELMVRVGPEGYEAALKEPGAHPMDFTGRPLREGGVRGRRRVSYRGRPGDVGGTGRGLCIVPASSPPPATAPGLTGLPPAVIIDAFWCRMGT
jgi:hypothetical protein